MREWLEWNLFGKEFAQFWRDWPERMATAGWRQWKWWNQLLFRRDSIHTEAKLVWLHHLFMEQKVLGDQRQLAGHVSYSKKEIFVGWTPPPPGFIKVNVDGASKGNLGIAGCGCVLRNHEGHWIVGAARNLGICSSGKAELWGAWLGLHMAWEHGFRRVMLETDSSIVYNLLTTSVQDSWGEDVLVNECRSLLTLDWILDVKKIYRETNYVADGVVNWVLNREVGVHVLSNPPTMLCSRLLADVMKVNHPRMVPDCILDV